MQRRQFMMRTMGLAAGAATGLSALPALAAGGGWRMPDEGERHAATWMAFGANDEVWGKRLKTGAQADLARIAQAIASVEPVHMLVNEEDYDVAARLCGNKVRLLVQPIDDLWMRDTGPVFVKQAGGALAGVNFNFNGWGEKQDYDDDALVAGFVAGRTCQRRACRKHTGPAHHHLPRHPMGNRRETPQWRFGAADHACDSGA